jgi:glycosyltransferase involved in cell wall biosynthesis
MAPRIRVLFLIPSLVANGAERQLVELVRHLDRERFEVHLATFYDPGPEANLWAEAAALPDLRLHSLHKRRGMLGHLAAMPRLLWLLLELMPDVLHGYMDDANLPLLAFGGFLRRPVVWGIRRTNKDLTKLSRLTRRILDLTVWLSRYVDLIIFNSESGRRNHVAMGMRAARMAVVSNGFDGELFHPDPALGAAQREAWGVPPTAPLVGIVGRFHPVKDHETFLRAAASLARTHPEARFVCVGEGPAGRLETLRELAGTLGLAERVLFPAGHLGMAPVYNALSFLVLSSTDEGFPNVLGEAMACGVPCVTTRVGDAELLVGPWGAVVEAGDAPGIAAALAAFLEEPEAARRLRAESARQRIVGTFGVAALATHTGRLMAELSARPAPSGAPLGAH